MRGWFAMAFLLIPVATVSAQQASTGSQTFGFYQCSCTPSSVGVPSTSSPFTVQTTQPWSGSVYASSDRDATSKAQSRCASETRGSLFSCLACSCSR